MKKLMESENKYEGRRSFKLFGARSRDEPPKKPPVQSKKYDSDELYCASEPELNFDRQKPYKKLWFSRPLVTAHRSADEREAKYSAFRPSKTVPPVKPARNDLEQVGKESPRPILTTSPLKNVSDSESSYASIRQWNDLRSVGAMESDRMSHNSSLSGTTTPTIVDEQARHRMDNLEKHIGQLSELVHLALLNQRSLPPSLLRDVHEIKKTFWPHTVRESDSESQSSEIGSEHGSYYLEQGVLKSPKDQRRLLSPAEKSNKISYVGWNDKQPFGVRLRNLQRETIELRFDLKNLRRQTESNCKQASFILQDAFHQIKAVLMKSENGNFLSNVQEITHHRDRFNGAVVKIERYLTGIEDGVRLCARKTIEDDDNIDVRQVEKLADALGHVGKSAAKLKNLVPGYQGQMAELLDESRRKLAHEEKHLQKDQNRVDDILRRCTKAAKAVITMRKLAKMQNADQSGNAYLPERAPSAPPYLHLQNSREDSRENLAKMNSATLQSFANVTLPAQHYSSSKSLSNSTSDILDLDALLDDLQSVSRSQTSLNSSPSGTAKFPSRSESFDSGNISTDGHYDESRDEVKELRSPSTIRRVILPNKDKIKSTTSDTYGTHSSEDASKYGVRRQPDDLVKSFYEMPNKSNLASVRNGVVHTNALDSDNFNAIRSASSSESVNSQKGLQIGGKVLRFM